MKTFFLALATFGLMLSARPTTHAQGATQTNAGTLTLSGGTLSMAGGATVYNINGGTLGAGTLTLNGSTLYSNGVPVALSSPYHLTPVTLTSGATGYLITLIPAFFAGQVALDASGNVDYLAFANGNVFGYYSFLSSDPRYLYHYDMGFEYVTDAHDGKEGVYLYDFKSQTFFYTSPSFPFPYLYDFQRKSVVYYCPDPSHPGRYNTDGVRWFYDFSARQYVSK